MKGHDDESARRICGEMQQKIEGRGGAATTTTTREAAFERLTCRRRYVTIKDGDVEVDWDGNQHKLLHVHNLAHTHVCVTADGEKHYERVPGGKDTAPPAPPSERRRGAGGAGGGGALAELYVRESAIKTPNQAITYQDKTKDKVYLKVFLIDGSVNQNHWGVRPDSITKNIYSAIGKPVVLYQNTGKEPDGYQRTVGEYDHPYLGGADSVEHAYAYQDLYRVATYIDVFESSIKPGQWWGVAEVTDDNVKRALREDPDLPMYVSPTIRLLSGANEPENAHSQWTFMHSAIVDRPAFGIDKAYIGGQCSGGRDTCLLQLRKAAIVANNNEIGCGFCTYKAVKEIQLRLRQASSVSSLEKFEEKLQTREDTLMSNENNQNNDPNNNKDQEQNNKDNNTNQDNNQDNQQAQQQSKQQEQQSQRTVEQQESRTTVSKKDSTNNNKQGSSVSDLREALDTIQRLAAENKNLQMQLATAKSDVDTHKQINTQYETRLASLEKDREQERAAVRKEQITNYVNTAPAYRALSAQEREKQVETFVTGSMSIQEIQSIIEPLNASVVKQFQFPNRSASVSRGPSRLSLGANTGKTIEVRSAAASENKSGAGEDELPFYLQLPDAMGLGGQQGGGNE